MTSVQDAFTRVEPRDGLSGFRLEFYDALAARADGLFELVDAMLCADGAVKSLVELSLVPEHRRGHGSLYDAVNNGSVDFARVRVALGALPVPRAADGRIVLAVDVSNWLRPDAATSPERLFCHVYGRGRSADQFIPGWPYSFVAALEAGRTSWTALLDAVRLGPADDATAVTAAQLRGVVERLVTAGHWSEGDPDIWIVADSGYDLALGQGLPVPGRARLRPARRAPAQARSRVRSGQTRKLAGARTRHGHGDRPVRHRRREGMGPAAPAADPPHLLARALRQAPDHRGHARTARSRAPARRTRPEAMPTVSLRSGDELLDRLFSADQPLGRDVFKHDFGMDVASGSVAKEPTRSQGSGGGKVGGRGDTLVIVRNPHAVQIGEGKTQRNEFNIRILDAELCADWLGSDPKRQKAVETLRENPADRSAADALAEDIARSADEFLAAGLKTRVHEIEREFSIDSGTTTATNVQGVSLGSRNRVRVRCRVTAHLNRRALRREILDRAERHAAARRRAAKRARTREKSAAQRAARRPVEAFTRDRSTESQTVARVLKQPLERDFIYGVHFRDHSSDSSQPPARDRMMREGPPGVGGLSF